MYKTNVTFENFEGEKVSKDLYFNLTKAEIMELQYSYEGGFTAYLDSIIHPISGKPDPKKVMDLFKLMIMKSYGVRTEDGGFRKNKDLAEEFLSTDAYSELFMKIINDEKAMNDFLFGILPREAQEQAKIEMEKRTKEIEETAKAVEDNVVPIPSSTN